MKQLLTPRLLLLIASLVICLAALLIYFTMLRPHTFAGTLLQSPSLAYDFSANGQTNQVVHLSDFRGKVVLLFFGFTYCKDICPLTLGVLKQALDAMGNQSGQVQVVMYSVDPERDTPQRMQSYLSLLDKRFLGVTADPQSTTQATKQFGVFFQKQAPDSNGNYEVEHTAIIQLIDTKGFLRVVYPSTVDPAALASDVEYILSH